MCAMGMFCNILLISSSHENSGCILLISVKIVSKTIILGSNDTEVDCNLILVLELFPNVSLIFRIRTLEVSI